LIRLACSVRIFGSFFFLFVELGVSLLDEGELETIALGEGDSWVLAVTDDENVLDTGGEGVTVGILDVSDVEGTWMLLDGLEDTNSTDVVSTSEVNRSSVDELVNTLDALISQVNLESIVLLDVWMWESEGSAVMGGHVWNLLFADVLLNNSAKLETGLLGVNFVRVESSLGVEKDSEELISFFNSNNVHLTKREPVVSSDLSINLDEALLLSADLQSFLASQSIAESLLKQNVHWDALSQLVRSWRGSSSVHAFEFTEIPVLRRSNSFHAFSLTFIALKSPRNSYD